MKKELSYRHMLVVAMPICILQILIDNKLLNQYLNIVLTSYNREEIIYSLISRKDIEEEDDKFKVLYILRWISCIKGFSSLYPHLKIDIVSRFYKITNFR